MKKNLLFCFSCILICNISFSQEKKFGSHSSQIQIEGLGPGGMLSFHFDSRFKKTINGLGYTIGLGIAPYDLLEESCNEGTVITIPVGLNYLFGKDHYFEIGAGGALKSGWGTKIGCLYLEDSFFENGESFYAYTLLGYRYQPKSKRLTIRAFISPLFQKYVPIRFWGGASIGIRFRR